MERSATRLAIEKYMQGVRPDAPWCPSNIEFIRRINGLDSIDDVYRTVFDASYLVLGLGDVYLGAPVATPIDPRHRLVTTKYNPARTWTPENAVGIGGAYLCVYGMEGPGGYQFVGRTVQMWNTHKSTAEFDRPWLLRFFDQIRFYPVSAEELLDMRDRFHARQAEAQDRDTSSSACATIMRFSTRSATARRRSRSGSRRRSSPSASAGAAAGQLEPPSETEDAPPAAESEIPPGCSALRAPATASVWRIETKPGDRMDAGGRVLILEAMKMEIAVAAPKAGVVVELLCKQGSQVMAGQPLLIYRAEEVA